MGSVLVVGCASFDTLHINRNGNRESFNTIGGAGLYTALAAAKQGANTYLFAPKPDPFPEVFEEFAKLVTWVGPVVPLDQMPKLEIEHHGGGRATLLGAAWGAESQMVPHDLPHFGHMEFDVIHIAALSSAEKQCQFAQTFGDEQSKSLISAGTYAQAIKNNSAAVCRLLDSVDLFFMNENESRLIYDDETIRVTKPGRMLFITSGAAGATSYTRDGEIYVPAIVAQELDPTGAGDTFCGAMLAGLTAGLNLESALKAAAYLAGKVVETPGPASLMEPHRS
ncbi:MAG: carbohydrate kinase family protein [Candidatus Melainabacteria bacterium]|nr:carbohydrate kinase family protein [Candidatus Melainabacteria bacterium]